MRFYLEQFVQTGEQVAYSGKAFFEDIDANDPGVIKEREKEYFQSKRYFLKKLIEESVPPDFYDCHEATVLMPGEYQMTGKFDILNNVYQLYNSGYYVLAIPAALLVNGFGDFKTNKYSYLRNNISSKASFLVPNSNIIIFNRDGVIINFLDVEEVGFWASKRVSSMLPLDFTPQGEENSELRNLDWVPLGFIANSINADDPISSKIRNDGVLSNHMGRFGCQLQ